MKKELVRLYQEFRNHSPFMLQGRNAELALSAARTLLEWEELESAGLVRIDVQPDNDFRKDWDCPTYCTEEHPCSACRAYASDGAWETIGEWRLSEDDEFESADSCCGHVGYNDVTSPYENCYIIDIMRATLDAYRAAKLASFGDIISKAY